MLGPGVVVGPFAFVGRKVGLNPRSSHADMIGVTRVGADDRIFPHAMSAESRDTGFAGESTRLESRTVLRERHRQHRDCPGRGCPTRRGQLSDERAHVGVPDRRPYDHHPFCGLGDIRRSRTTRYSKRTLDSIGTPAWVNP